MNGKSYSIFVGSHGHPFVRAGPITALQDEDIHAQTLVKVQSVSKITEQLQEIAKSIKPVDSELEIRERGMREDELRARPVELRRLELSGAKIPKKIESLTTDTVSATEVMDELRSYGELTLTNLLSSGSLGKEKKLVPTKWSITAVDSFLSKREYGGENIHKHAFKHSFLGNTFHIYFFPGPWSLDFFEIGEGLAHDYERPKKSKINETAGAYYAVRLAISEYLGERTGRVIVIRECAPSVGVWAVREGMRETLKQTAFDVEEFRPTCAFSDSIRKKAEYQTSISLHPNA